MLEDPGLTALLTAILPSLLSILRQELAAWRERRKGKGPR